MKKGVMRDETKRRQMHDTRKGNEKSTVNDALGYRARTKRGGGPDVPTN